MDTQVTDIRLVPGKRLNALVQHLLYNYEVQFFTMNGALSTTYEPGCTPLYRTAETAPWFPVPDYSGTLSYATLLMTEFDTAYSWHVTNDPLRPSGRDVSYTVILSKLGRDGTPVIQFRADEATEARAIATAAYRYCVRDGIRLNTLSRVADSRRRTSRVDARKTAPVTPTRTQHERVAVAR